MRELNQSEGTTFVFSTRDTRVMGYASRVIELADGRLALRPTPTSERSARARARGVMRDA
jgi:putative ABC transport system ATP-binding protein